MPGQRSESRDGGDAGSEYTCARLADQLGALRPGFLADLALFRLAERDFKFEDSARQRLWDTQKVEPAAVIRRGRAYRSELRLEQRLGRQP